MIRQLGVHDVLNVFQATGLVDDCYFMSASPARQGDFFEFMAEIDLLCALSTCPGGDLSLPLWGPDAADTLSVCRPLGVQVFSVDAELLEGWAPPEPSPYAGMHGLRPAATSVRPGRHLTHATQDSKLRPRPCGAAL